MKHSEKLPLGRRKQALVEGANRFMTALGYVEAAKMTCCGPIGVTSPPNAVMILPVNMLSGFALELYLKAWLLFSGRSSVTVKGYGYRLRDLFEEAKSAGLPKIDGLDDVLADLAEGHADFTFRYVNSGDVVRTPDWAKAFPIFEELHDAVGMALVVATQEPKEVTRL
jgi:hypothetical protein